jgi:hypothetical protein
MSLTADSALRLQGRGLNIQKKFDSERAGS